MASIEKKLPAILVEQPKNHDDGSSNNNSSDSDVEIREKSKHRKSRLAATFKHERRGSGSSVGDDDEMIPLTDDLREQIITQAEYYFSDENLKKDGFLLKHVKRNKEGFVNLKLLASFKKMRSISRDYRVIGEALKDSTKLVVNDTGLKLKRVEPLPKELLEQVRVKHVVVSKIPNENPSMSYITDAFPEHKDDVVSVRIVKPGKKFPNDLQSHFSRHPELRDECVGIVEFDNADLAAEIMKNTTFSDSYKGMELKLLELGPKQAKKMDGDATSDTPVDSDGSVGGGSIGRRSSSKKIKNGNRLLEISGVEDSYSSSDSEFSSFGSCTKRYNRSRGSSPVTSPQPVRRFDGNNNSKHTSPRASPSTSPNVSPKFPRKNRPDKSPVRNGHKLSPLVSNSPRSSPDIRRRGSGKSNGQSNNEEETNGNISPWMKRKMQMNASMNNDTVSLRAGGNKLLDIVRQPKGPDGSSGFNNNHFNKYVLLHAC